MRCKTHLLLVLLVIGLGLAACQSMNQEYLKNFEIVTGDIARAEPGRAEKDNGVFDVEIFKPVVRLKVLGEHAQRPAQVVRAIAASVGDREFRR